MLFYLGSASEGGRNSARGPMLTSVRRALLKDFQATQGDIEGGTATFLDINIRGCKLVYRP